MPDNGTRKSNTSVVQENWNAGDWSCDRCGDAFHLYFNGGELDGHSCRCGRRWFQESVGYVLKMEDCEDVRTR